MGTDGRVPSRLARERRLLGGMGRGACGSRWFAGSTRKSASLACCLRT